MTETRSWIENALRGLATGAAEVTDWKEMLEEAPNIDLSQALLQCDDPADIGRHEDGRAMDKLLDKPPAQWTEKDREKALGLLLVWHPDYSDS